MDDLINRQDAIAVIRATVAEGMLADTLELRLNELPSAEKTGKWIWKGEEGDSRFMCSVCYCKENVPTCNGKPTIWEYCPNCGSLMREGYTNENISDS